MTTFQRTDSGNADFQDLVKLLDEDLAIRDGAEHAFYDQYNKIVNIKHAMVCYLDGQPIGCGAFKEYDEHTVEIKRMYVKPEYRSKGIGLYILRELELWAAELNYPTTILETGKKQPEAIRLYEKAGYTRIKNFGQYENVENSVCMSKDISL
ncbi:GNAT family N-acetyltransferase [Niastella yeongjuensis]|uniref:GNAT family N-acetyltransferase n=1 Tax=Niastella yeongjuensis TaxID=354355 RepID=A0A1V9EUJ2_9BACT|nr:GNAT family N-acetyltransferase [Niastella yeongjuensis]OQP49751.1 GNAT family N-acetyltransferase [Niastella yeongjuensis]SEP40627.1 Acetyltransferase (GNAT) family protein [Niastella yeongjuensis]